MPGGALELYSRARGTGLKTCATSTTPLSSAIRRTGAAQSGALYLFLPASGVRPIAPCVKEEIDPQDDPDGL
jgi:hypothetical protein